MRVHKFNFIIPYVIYPFDVMVSFNETDEELLRKLRRYDICQEDKDLVINLSKTTMGRTALFQTGQTVIRIFDNPEAEYKNADIHSTIAHEVFHAVTFLFYHLKLPLDVTVTDEPYAYTVGYLTKEIYKRLKK